MIKILKVLLFSALVSMPAWASGIPASVQEVSHIHRPNDMHYTAGQPTESQLQAFAELGVRHVVDLRPPEESSDINEAAWVSASGMAYYHIPIASGEDLNSEHVEVLDTILQRIGDEPALLHCASSNRVGAMIALHAVWHDNMELEDAIERGKDYGLTSLESVVRQRIAEND
ncbi:serine/threonine protein phosphatase [Aliidiomarina sedimenti]|uniref:Serine/threonine protein phosphatase n=1 Tax=Aliidiomarina sedimenti TaxID=1933879 RepID=A0ABY0C0H1_9GAMM|nr:sulfur transferase domain-containing protein [Aliidiomarina sedimenti]RUO30844.1 serine/threonine protein phosphatase [Aliidiomarina sedimenti]